MDFVGWNAEWGMLGGLTWEDDVSVIILRVVFVFCLHYRIVFIIFLVFWNCLYSSGS